MKLYPYQRKAARECIEYLKAGKRVVLVAPTGAGKTVIAIPVAKQYGRVLLVAHRREIIDQASVTFGDKVHAVSIQKLSTSTVKLPRGVDLIIIDEAHRAAARTYRDLIGRYPKARLLGLTATPVRTDGQGLAGIFDVIVKTPGYIDLLDHDPAVLVPYRAFEAPDEALKQLALMKKNHGDYRTADLSTLMNQPRLIGNAVREYKAHAVGRKAICFAVSITHSRDLVKAFCDAGIRAVHVDGSTHPLIRQRSLDDLRDGRIDILSNVNLFTEGWDCPPVDCVIIERPTASKALHFQSIGRALRAFAGKKDTIILDHSGNLIRHGRPELCAWDLETDRSLKRRKKREALDGDRRRLGFSSIEAMLEERRRSLMTALEASRIVGVNHSHIGIIMKKYGVTHSVPIGSARYYMREEVSRVASEIQGKYYSILSLLELLGVSNTENARRVLGRASISPVKLGDSYFAAKADVDDLLKLLSSSITQDECLKRLNISKGAWLGVENSIKKRVRWFQFARGDWRYSAFDIECLANELDAYRASFTMEEAIEELKGINGRFSAVKNLTPCDNPLPSNDRRDGLRRCDQKRYRQDEVARVKEELLAATRDSLNFDQMTDVLNVARDKARELISTGKVKAMCVPGNVRYSLASVESIAPIVRRYSAGLSLKEAVEILHCDPKAARYILSEIGINPIENPFHKAFDRFDRAAVCRLAVERSASQQSKNKDSSVAA